MITTLNPAMLRQAYLIASNELKTIEDRMDTIRRELKELERRAEPVFNVKSALAHIACSACLGHGKTWHQYAQDDIKLETCLTCQGTGLSKEAM